MNLNTQQREAIEWLHTPLLVLAGAGSGKTRVITEKITHLIRHGWPAHQIAAITFTNKAAQEMQERVAKLVNGKDAKALTVCTFHSLGMRILREEAPVIGLKKHFSILDAADSARIVAEHLGSSGREPLMHAQHQISLWKNELTDPETAAHQAKDAWQQQIAAVYAAYQDTLASYQAVDFDDLIGLPCRILDRHPESRHRWQLRLRYLLIDECQDTNASQYRLMKLITGQDGRFTAVGDDDQSIYAWRGADINNLRRLQDDYPDLKIIKLEQNYRSSARILRVANAVIAHNPKVFSKSLWSRHDEGAPVTILTCRDETHEAETVVQKINNAVLLKKCAYRDFAVLYRGNHQARLFEEALRSQRIPYRISGGQSFFERTEIKDILAWVRLAANSADDPAFLRAITTPKRGIGNTTLEKLNDYARQAHVSLFQAASSPHVTAALATASRHALEHFMTLVQTFLARAPNDSAGVWIHDLVKAIHYESWLEQTHEGKSIQTRWRNVQDLLAWLDKKGRDDGKNIIELAQTIALMTLLEGRDDEDPDAVRLSTLHAAKGLEYPHVFIVGCEEGLLPHENSIADNLIEEERRLMYVGITRAEKTLTLTHAKKRRRAGNWQFGEPSRFLEEIPPQEVQILGRDDTAPIVSTEEGRALFRERRRRAQTQKDG